MKILTILNCSTGVQVGDRIGCADTSLTRLHGLLGRKELAPGAGVWIRPSSGVHTFGMRFAIDVVGLDRTMRVVRLWPGLKPNRATPLCRGVHSVLELAAGEIHARQLKVGDVISPAHNEHLMST